MTAKRRPSRRRRIAARPIEADVASAITRYTPVDALPENLRVPECARCLDTSEACVREAITSRELVAFRVGRLMRVSKTALVDFRTTTANGHGGGR